VDWSSIAANAGGDITWNDGVVIHNGEKGLRYGQVMTLISSPANDVATITGAPTGGTFTLTIATQFGTQTTTGIAFNALASVVATALNTSIALLSLPPSLLPPNPGMPPTATVTGSAGGPYSIGFPATLGVVTLTASGTGLTGGTSPGVTITVNVAASTAGMYAPYDPAATDGRQNLVQGSAFILNESMRQTDLASDHPEAIYGGLTFLARIIQAGTGAASLAAGPTLANLQTAFPRLAYVTD
jgi:hypothetical protein